MWQKCAFTILVANLFLLFNHQLISAQIKRKVNNRNATALELLRRDILKGYDKFSRPAEHNKKTTVNFVLSIYTIHVDEADQTMRLNAINKMNWTDNKLKWNSSDYSGLESIVFADHEIWQPDIYLHNSATGNTLNYYNYSQCIVSSDGRVSWAPQTVSVVFCELDLTYWPFDKQECVYQFGSWTQHSEQIKLISTMHVSEKEQYTEKVDLYPFQPLEWRIKVHSKLKLVYFKHSTNPFSSISFFVTAKRESLSYFFLLFFSALAMVFMIFLMFSFPLLSQMRLMISCGISAYIGIFLFYLSQRLPVMGLKTPRIVVFYSAHLVMIFVAIIVSVFSRSICSLTISVPRKVMTIMYGPTGRFLGLQAHQDAHIEELSDGRDDAKINVVSKSHPWNEWCLISIALDRIIFILYVFVFLCLIVSFKV